MEDKLSAPPPSYQEVLHISKVGQETKEVKESSHEEVLHVSKFGKENREVKEALLVEDKAIFWKSVIVTVIALIIVLVVLNVVYCNN